MTMKATRRQFLRWIGTGVLGVTALDMLAACAREAPPLIKLLPGNQLDLGSLTVPLGTTVTSQNIGVLPQTVTCDPSKATDPNRVKLPQNAQPWDSGELYPGQSWSYTFQTPGTYVYFSRLQ